MALATHHCLADLEDRKVPVVLAVVEVEEVALVAVAAPSK